MSLRSFLLALPLVAAACTTTPARPEPAGTHIGRPLEPHERHSYAEVSAAPADHFEETLWVEGTVTAVCQKAGCWMQIEDQGQTALVRWETGCGGEYAFPADAVGKQVLIQGSFYPKEISPEDVEHLREEAGVAVEIPADGCELNASAVVVLDETGR